MGAPIKKRVKLPPLNFVSDRRFGIEFEILAFDGKSRPDHGHKPAGIDDVALLVARNATEKVDIREWEHTQGNDDWVIKPDSSCGMEICTPIMKGWNGLRKCCDVSHAFMNDPQIKVDQRCSVHVHVEVADLTHEQLASVIAHWFKVEPVFMDAMPPQRKRNRYCQFMGMTNLLQHDSKFGAGEIAKRVGNVKYYSVNTNQMIKNGRKTIEFRTIEGEGVKDPFTIKNWVRLIIHFVEMTKNRPFPSQFKEGDAWSSFLWLDPEDVMRVLGFSNNPQQYELSPGLQQTRNWFLGRLQKFIAKDVDQGPRNYAYHELQKICAGFRDEGINISDECLSPPDLKNALYNDETKS